MKSCQYCINQNRCSGYINNDISDVIGYLPSETVDEFIDVMEEKAEICDNYEELTCE